MHYEDLIERLRNGTALPMIQALLNEAADTIESLEQRLKEKEEKEEKVECAIYDEETIYPNCTVQIWRNSETGEYSIGFWENEDIEECDDGE